MTEENRELFFDLLTKKAVYGLDDAEQAELDSIDNGSGETEFGTLEMAAAAITMAGLETDEPLPAHLYSKIAADAAQYVGAPVTASVDGLQEAEPVGGWQQAGGSTKQYSQSGTGSGSWFGWLGWAFAAAALVVLAVNIWFTRVDTSGQANVPPPVDIPQVKTYAEMRAAMLSSTAGMVTATWTVANPKDTTPVSGDIVWSDEKQMGYMRFRGLPVNDAKKETYQVWIFDKTQDKATPIDGGTFDISSDGEVVIPINAKLKAQGPEMFAVTVERPGGVVVSKRERIAAIAKDVAPMRSST